MTVDQLEAEARKLSVLQQEQLLERLLRSYGRSVELREETARAWKLEAARRDRAIEEGAEEEVAADQLFPGLGSQLQLRG